jgi:Predicted Fe-S oxidoreductase
MLIKDLMQIVWAERKDKFTDLFKAAQTISAQGLYDKVKSKKMICYSYPSTNINLFSCSACDYRLKNNFSGCSMCDYEADDLLYQAQMSALRLKNKTLYAKAIKDSFENMRGKRPAPNIFELISSDDIFSESEFPEEVFYELFKKDALFSKNPFSYIFETRASSITKEKLKLMKKYLPENCRVMIEFGVETGNEWIRNHWLNKDISDAQIIKAIQMIHEAGYKASADVLIGIPGLTEMQSKKVFMETIFWLEYIGVDQFVVLPLNRKKHTLQGIIHKYLSDDPVLHQIGISQQDHTGIPWLTTVICSINDVFREKPELINKLNLAQVYSFQNSVKNDTTYNKYECLCNEKLINVLGQYQIKRNIDTIKEAASYALSDQHECNQNYQELLQKQSNQTIYFTMKSIISRLTPHIWSNSHERIKQSFEKELEEYREGIIDE